VPTDHDSKLAQVKARKWFYEFDLPDGSRTAVDIPASILPIHTSRLNKLEAIIMDRVGDASALTAIDLASHEGYYSIALARHFKSVRGYEIRPSSLQAARLITETLGVRNVDYVSADLQTMPFDPAQTADFVLLYGLIYHLENPIHTIRLASQMARRHILIETQLLPFNITGDIEDGSYLNARPIEGLFGLTSDYAQYREGGSTDLALVPSLNGLMFLLKTFGFSDIAVLPSGPGDYEQYRRGARAIIYGRKP
jgi:hypothetical protein